MGHLGYPLLEVLCCYGVLPGAETFVDCHSPSGLVFDPASLREQREPGDELSYPDFRLPVLLHFKGKQLNRSAQEIGVERPSDAGVVPPDRLRLETPGILAR